MARWIWRGSVAVLLALLCAGAVGSTRGSGHTDLFVARVEAQGTDLGTDAQRESGRVLYVKNCAQCHGDKGDGNGYATPHLYPRPRDFTTGAFKVRTTPNGSLPVHQDIVNIIRRGMPYTSMPAWPELSDQEVSDLAYYLKTFSANFSNAESVPQPMEFPDAPATSEESVELGRKLYVETGYPKCQGNLGRGDGPSAPTLTDDFRRPIRAADLSHPWTFRGGPTREDIFRTMTTGLNGTPMPSFTDALTPEQRWAITDFILSLSGGEGPDYTNLVVATQVLDPIDLAAGAASFEGAPIARFPILGQITEPGRSFHPPATDVTVQAIYDAESVALLVRWHDMGSDRSGKNGPTLQVSIEEEEAATGGEEPSSDNPFGDAEIVAEPSADPFAEEVPAAPASEFSDAVAVQIPSVAPAGARKPYFIFGDAQAPVDLWFFDLAQQAPLQYAGRGSADVMVNDTGDLTGVASYDQGEWTAIFKRPLRPSAGAVLAPGQFMPVAFSVWDGFSRERGNRRGLTVWHSLYLEPEVAESAVGPMIRTALLLLALELIVIGLVRWRNRPPTEQRRRTQEAATSA